MTSEDAGAYDLVVIGGGPGGYVAAIKAAQLGLKVVHFIYFIYNSFYAIRPPVSRDGGNSEARV